MNPSAVQYLIKVKSGKLDDVRKILDASGWQPKDEPEGQLHFASAVLFPPDPQNDHEGHLLSIEACADVLASEVSALLANHPALAPALKELHRILGAQAGLTTWLDAHRLPFATVGIEAAGLPFHGTPGMSVQRIHKEAAFAHWVRQLVRSETTTTTRPPTSPRITSPLLLLQKVRADTFHSPQWKDMLVAEPTQLLAPARAIKGLALAVALVALRDHLWILLFWPALAVLLCLVAWPLLPHPEAIHLSALNLHSTALVVVACLLGMTLLDAIRLRGWKLRWLVVAAAVTPLLWLSMLCLRLGTDGAANAIASSLAQVVAVLGLGSGLVLIWRSCASWRLGLKAGFLLCLVVVGAWPSGPLTSLAQGWPWLSRPVVWLCSALLLLLCLLALAWIQRSISTKLSSPTQRIGVVITLGILATHVALNPDEAVWLVVIAVTALCLELLGLVTLALAGFQQLRDQEEADRPLDREPDRQQMAEILAHEDQVGVVQNHLAAQSIVKPGWFRIRVLKLALWAVEQITTTSSPAGFLDRIGTIHHARWLVVPGTRRLLFLSNYDGSWQSYLEDFISRIRRGLTTIWSNTNGFPRSFRLTDGGASDGGRFKRWARRQQVPSSLWFSAYPTLTTSSIRTNAAIRVGLLGAQTEREAARWLERMGEAVGQPLDRANISTLVLGGVGQMPYAALLALSYPNSATAIAFVRHWRPKLSYGGVQGNSALSLAFSHAGVTLLGLNESVLAMLPEAFLAGMTSEYRARKLGDPEDAVLSWNDADTHAVMLVHAQDAHTLSVELSDIAEYCHHCDIKEKYSEMLGAAAPAGPQSVANPLDVRDGISQPRIRGLDKTLAPGDTLHAVAPGEILLGHPDNLGRPVPTPADGGTDPLLNSSFLVVRQLAFRRLRFDRYLLAESLRQLPAGTVRGDQKCVEAQQMLAAKMLGRWPSGVSLLKSALPDPAWMIGPPSPADNDFLLGRDDPQGLRCPLGAHIRRMNPRDSFDPGSKTQLAISNRHRILRLSRRFLRPAAGQQPAVEGLMFMCLNADIERQFEFLQQTWGLGANFHGLDNEVDPLLSTGSGACFSIPMGNSSRRLPPLPRLTTLLGGGYFLLPGKALLDEI